MLRFSAGSMAAEHLAVKGRAFHCLPALNQESGIYAASLKDRNHPAEILRQEVERRLFGNGCRDYEGLAQWVRSQGYEISDDSLWRYGRAPQQQLAAAELTVRHARALAKLGEDHKGLTAQALITVAQQQALARLLEMEEVKAADLNAIAHLTRAAIALQRSNTELRARGEQQPHPPAAKPEPTPKQAQINAQPAISPQQQAQATNFAVTCSLPLPGGRGPAAEAGAAEGPSANGKGILESRAESAAEGPSPGAARHPLPTGRGNLNSAPLRACPRIAEIAIPFCDFQFPFRLLPRCFDTGRMKEGGTES